MWVTTKLRQEALRRGYSRETIRTYNYCLDKFFRYCHKDPKAVTKKDIERYVDAFVQKKAASSTINVHLSALQFLYKDVLHKRLCTNIKYAKRTKRLPTFLTKEEIQGLLQAISNKKHQLIVELLYSAGLRVSEVLNLQVKDLQISLGQGWVRQGKGRKDRPFIIAKKLQEKLRDWVKHTTTSPQSYLFTNSQNKKLTTSTVRALLKKAVKTAKLMHVHPHLLRHSFATHLAQRGCTASNLQKLLGHQSIETTLVYTHVAQVQLLGITSPYD